MKNNYKNRVYNVRNKQNEKDFKNNKSQRTKNFLAYVLAFFMMVWSICSVLGTIAFFRDGKQENNVLTAYAASNEYEDDVDYDNNFPNSVNVDRLGKYANSLQFPYYFLPNDWYSKVENGNNNFSFNGLGVSLNNGGTLTLNGIVNTKFELILSFENVSLYPGSYYYLYTGVLDKIPFSRCVIAYYDSLGSITYHNMRNPLAWSSSYRFSHAFIRFDVGDNFEHLTIYPSLLRGDANFLNSIDKNGGSNYFVSPINYGYYYGFKDGIDSGYKQGYEDALQRLKSSYFLDSQLYIRPNDKGVSFVEYSFDYVNNGISIKDAISKADYSFTQLYPDYGKSIEIVLSFEQPIYFDLLKNSLTFNGWSGVLGTLYCYDEPYEMSNGFPFTNYAASFYNGNYSFLVNAQNLSVYYIRLSVIYSESNQDYIIYDSNNNYNQIYQYGYDKGYDKGVDVGKNDNSLYNNGYDVGYNIGYSKGAQDSESNPYTFKKLLSAIIDTPVQIFAQVFDFNVLGVNLTQFFFSLLSVCFILTVIKLII